MWPGIEIKLLVPKQAHNQKVPARTADDQAFWARQNTMPTSMLMAYTMFAIHNSYRNAAVRAKAVEGLASIVSLMASCLGGFQLQHKRFGDESSCILRVDTTGNIDALSFWTPGFFRQHVYRLWAADFALDNKTWITHEPGMGKIPFAEVLAFCLDPSHKPAFKQLVTSGVLTLLTYLAHELDEAVPRIRHDAEAMPSTAAAKNTAKRARKTATLLESVANTVWSGQDTSTSLVAMGLTRFGFTEWVQPLQLVLEHEGCSFPDSLRGADVVCGNFEATSFSTGVYVNKDCELARNCPLKSESCHAIRKA